MASSSSPIALLHTLFALLVFSSTTSLSLEFTPQTLLRREFQQSKYSSDTPALPLSPSDAAALRAIKSSLRDLPGSDFFSTWDFSNSSSFDDDTPASLTPCFSFAGVLCSFPSETDTNATTTTTDGTAAPGPSFLRVTSLALGTGRTDSPGLYGTLPPALANLTALTQLIVFPGRVSGPIPPEIFTALTSLRFVSITGNLISGSIPPSLTSLNELHTLDLGRNRLYGPVPPGIFSLPQLKVLVLASNGYLSDQLPNAVTSPLIHLDMRGNSFTGPIPGTLPMTLGYFSASMNSLSGTLDSVAGLPDLAFLDLAGNQLTGPVPASLLSPSVPLLLLQKNQLSGQMPTINPSFSASLADDDNGVLPSPTSGGWTVDLSHNMLSGPLTAALAGAESVYINNNRLSGAVPSEYARSVYAGTLRTFYAQHNFLTGFDSPVTEDNTSPAAFPLPEHVTVCLAYNCMAAPRKVGPTVCPSSAGEEASRPPWQCPEFGNATSFADGGRG